MKISKQSLINPLSIISMLILVIAVGAPWMTSLVFVDMVDYKAYLVSAFLLISMIIYWLFSINTNNKLLLNNTQLYLIIFMLFSSVSFLWVDNQQLFIGKWFLYLFGFISFYLAIKIKHSTKNHVHLATVIATASAIVSTIGIFQYLFEVPIASILPYENIPASTFGNKNAANQMITLTFPLVVYLIISKVNRYQFTIAAWALVSTVIYVYYAETKSVWIALLLESLIMTIYLFYSRRLIKFNFLKSYKVLFLLSFIFLFLSLDYISNKSSFNTESKAGVVVSTLIDRYSSQESPRKLIWRSAINIGNKSPIMGTGLGSFEHQLSLEGAHAKLRRAHNDILEMYVELGLLGVTIFTLFCFYLTKDLVLINKKNSKPDTLFINILMIALIGSFVNMMFSWPYQTVYGIVLFSIFVALIVQKAKDYDQKIFTFILPRWLVLISKSLIILLLLSSVFTYRLWIDNISDFYRYSGTSSQQYDAAQLSKYAKNISNRDSHINSIATDYWVKGDIEAASTIYSIASLYNPSNMLALYRQFITLIDESELDKAEALILIMTDNHKMHPLTFRASLILSRNKKDMNSAKKTYEFYKNHFDSLYTVDYRAYKALVRWSVILSDYKNTKRFYDIYLSNGSSLDSSVENSMANFYVYTQQYDKATKHMNYVLKNEPHIIRPEVLQALKDKDLIKK